MLLPTIKLIPEIETIFIENLYRGQLQTYKSIIEKDRPEEMTTKFYLKQSNRDFITNFLCGNIKQQYKTYFWNYLSGNSSATELLLKSQENISFRCLVLNQHPDAIYLIEKNIKRILASFNIYFLGENPAAINVIEKHLDRCSNAGLSANKNPAAVDLFFKHKATEGKDIWNTTCCDCKFLSNPNCMDLFLKYLEIDPVLFSSKNEEDINTLKYKITRKYFSWYCLSINTHPIAFQILKLFPHKISPYIVTNPSPLAVEMIKEYFSNISSPLYDDAIGQLCKNTNPDALNLLHNLNSDCYDWVNLSENPSAIPFLMSMGDELKTKIKVEFLLNNPSVFQYNYENMKENIAVFKEELIQRVWSPANVLKWAEQGYDDFLES
jgi:hypothetical protein